MSYRQQGSTSKTCTTGISTIGLYPWFAAHKEEKKERKEKNQKAGGPPRLLPASEHALYVKDGRVKCEKCGLSAKAANLYRYRSKIPGFEQYAMCPIGPKGKRHSVEQV